MHHIAKSQTRRGEYVAYIHGAQRVPIAARTLADMDAIIAAMHADSPAARTVRAFHTLAQALPQ